MKLRNILFTAMLIMLFLTGSKVLAYCDNKELSNYKREAYKIEYDFNFDDAFNTSLEYYMNITVTNFNKNMIIVDSKGSTFVFDESNKDKITSLGIYNNGAKVVFKIYTSTETNCPNTLLHTKTYQLPHYNIYSKHVACEGAEEFELCDRWYPKEITNEKNFVEAVHAWEKAQAEKDKAPSKVPISTQVINFVKDNYLYLLGGALIIAVSVVGYRVNKNKNKIKIKLED